MRNYLEFLVSVHKCEIKCVEIRSFCRPFQRILHFYRSRKLSVIANSAFGGLNLVSACIAKAHFHLASLGFRCSYHYAEFTVAIVIDKIGSYENIVYMFLGTSVEIYFASYTCQTPEVLVFEIRAIAPAHNLHCHEIFLAGNEIFRYIEFGSSLAVFAISHEFAVYPYFEIGSCATYVKIYVAAFPGCGNFKLTTVRAGVVVLFFHEWRVVLKLCCPGVAGILVCGIAISVNFKKSGHFKIHPFGIVISGLLEIERAFVVVFHEIEFPLSFRTQIKV